MKRKKYEISGKEIWRGKNDRILKILMAEKEYRLKICFIPLN